MFQEEVKMKLCKKMAFVMAVITIVMAVLVPVSASEVMPRYNNTHATSENFFISDDGVATISALYTGYQGVTEGAVFSILLQKKTLLWWSDVEEWAITKNGWTNSVIITRTLESRGKYRAIIGYLIDGKGGATDEMSFTLEYEY